MGWKSPPPVPHMSPKTSTIPKIIGRDDSFPKTALEIADAIEECSRDPTKHTDGNVTSSVAVQEDVSSMKWISLALMLIQNAITPLVFRWATTSAKADERFSTFVAIGCQELLKLFLSVALVVAEENNDITKAAQVLRSELMENPDTMKLCIPAVFFVIQNSMMQLATVHLPAALFQVLWQGKTLVVAALSVVLLDKRLVHQAWLAIGLMALGIAVVQLSQSKEGGQASMANAEEQNPMLGLMYVGCGCLSSGFAAVYLEKLFKQKGKDKKTSMWVQNTIMAVLSIVLTATPALLSQGTVQGQDTHTLFHGFNISVWIMVVNNAVGGLLVALVIKHADNILRGFATALATILATLGAVFSFGFELHASFLLGTLLVVGSSLLYGGTIKLSSPWWQEESRCRRTSESPTLPL